MEQRNETIRQMLSDGSTYQVVGDRFGISRERVRQIAEKLGVAGLRKSVGKSIRAAALIAPTKRDKTASKTDISIDRLKELLHYDRFTGEWTWLVDRGRGVKAGDPAGGINPDGYVQIRVDYKLYMAHVLAWFYSFGVWPSNMVDHADRVKNHNWLNNLRQATYSQNFGNTEKRKNNTSGFKGVYRDGDRWRAEIAHIKLGRFNTPEEASVAYEEASKTRYGRFAVAS